MLFQFINSRSSETFFQPATSGISFLRSLKIEDKDYSTSRFLLSDFSIGDKCNNLGSKLKERKQSVYCRAGGTHGVILQRYT